MSEAFDFGREPRQCPRCGGTFRPRSEGKVPRFCSRACQLAVRNGAALFRGGVALSDFSSADGHRLDCVEGRAECACPTQLYRIACELILRVPIESTRTEEVTE